MLTLNVPRTWIAKTCEAMGPDGSNDAEHDQLIDIQDIVLRAGHPSGDRIPGDDEIVHVVDLRDDWASDVDEAFEGDSNDAEHDLLMEIYELLGGPDVVW